jgi:hypothetical protein
MGMPKPKRTPDIFSAVKHRGLFGSLPAFQSLNSRTGLTSVAQDRVCVASMKASYPLCTTRERPPIICTVGVYMVSDRRSGKSFISSLVATYLACFSHYGKQLSAGERAVILVFARDRDQGRVCFA